MKKIITSIFTLLVSLNTMAESYIYLTNNTDQPLDLRIEQSGSSLTKGEHWWQLADSVPPYGTVRFLETNRDTGIKWGKTYYYDTYVTAPDGSEVILQQKLKGTWNFSDIWHGVKQSPWYDDRGLYSERQSFVGKSSTVAFRAEYARVNGDDIYYVIHPDPEYPQQGPSNELNVLAYNVWALLPGLVSKDVTDRLTEISKRLEGFDVVVFSELFENSRREDFLDRIRGQFPYQTRVVDRSGSVEDGGVLIVSRWPIEHEAQTTFSSCDADDCMAAKGVMYARINKNGQKYHVFGSHTQAWTAPENQATRAHQFAEMKSFIDQQGIAAEEPVIIAGDLNVDKAHFPSEYQAMLSTLNASEVAQTADSYAYTADGNVNAWTDGRPEFLDYVLTSNAHLQPVNGTSKVRVPRSIAANVFTDYDLSDHFAIEAQLTFDTEINDSNTNQYRELKVAGVCMDTSNNSANGNNVFVHSCWQPATWQKWLYETSTGFIRNQANPHMCLDATNGNSAGTSVKVWACEDHINLKWDFVGETIRPRKNHDLVLDAFGTHDGADLGLWTYHGGVNQQWSWGQ